MKKIVSEYFSCTLGAVLFVFGVNVVIAPLGLYNGGFVGIGQIVRYVLEHFFHFTLNGVDIAGIVYLLINLPLFVLAYRSMHRVFLFKTLYTVILQAILLSLVPIPAKAFTQDILTGCIVGGIVAGVGVGMILRAGSSGGGQDILGVYMSAKVPGFSVGKITLIVNGFVYGCCAILFDIEVVVYSLIYTVIMSFVIDAMHSQNNNNAVLVLSKKPGLADFLIREIKRGVTVWNGKGGYTNEDITIAFIVLSQYELPALKHKLAQFDEHAFVSVTRISNVFGNFEKRLDA